MTTRGFGLSDEHRPDLRLISRMLWSLDDARAILDAVDPGHFQHPRERRLFVSLARSCTQTLHHPVTMRARILETEPDLLPAFDELLVYDDGYTGVYPEDVQSTVKAFIEWAYSRRLEAALEGASELRSEGKSARDIRVRLGSELDALDGLSLDTRRYDDLEAQHGRMMAFARGEGKHGLAFGYSKLDYAVTPLLSGNLLVVGGAPGTGKTTFARNLIRNWVDAGRRVVLMSLEMPGDEQLANFACMDIGLDYGRFVRQQLSEEEIDALGRAAQGWVTEGRLVINERISASPDWIMRQLKRYRIDGYDLFVVDHLHHAHYGVRENETRIAVSNFIRDLKSFASEHDSIVMALSQYAKIDKSAEPDDMNVKETFTIAEVADKMFHVFRPKVAGQRNVHDEFTPHTDTRGRTYMQGRPDAPPNSVFEPDPTHVYVKIGKQRVRPVNGIVSLPYRESSGRIYDTRPGHAA